jgi:peptidoglycan/LPS O-acetylase OafA/YrhL
MRWLRNLYERTVDQRTGSGWRLPQLDGVRGVAAMLVLLSHVLGRTEVSNGGWWWSPISRGGVGGVVLFFALSGFLLYLPWLRSHAENRPRPRLAHYALRRCLRIMPAYYVSVIALAVLRVVFAGKEPLPAGDMVLHFVFLPTLGAPLQTVYWTLQTEEFFYWLLPWFHSIVVRFGGVKLWIGCAAVAAVWGVCGALLLPTASFALWLEQTPLFLPAFGLGIGTALLWHRDRTRPGARRLVWIGTLGYIAASPLMAYIAEQSDQLLTPLTMLMMAPFASAIVLGAARGGAPILEHPIMRFLGAISFSIYLWHFVVIRFVPVPGVVAESFLLRAALTTAITIPVATLSYLFIERPFLRLRPS